jgi:hypothetical protein
MPRVKAPRPLARLDRTCNNSSMALSSQQQKFVNLYVNPGDCWLNPTKAYRGAYPNCKSDGSARRAASRLLTKNALVKTSVETELELRRTESAKQAAEREKLRLAEIDGRRRGGRFPAW